MNTRKTFTQLEVDSAWALWRKLLEHMEVLWARYEEPFSERMHRERHLERFQAPWPEDLTDDDIPF